MRAPGRRRERLRSKSAFDEAAEQWGSIQSNSACATLPIMIRKSGRPWSSNSLLECYRVGAERFGWSQRPAQGAAIDGRWRVGWGMAGTLYPAIRQACRVRVELAVDASLRVQCGTQDMGSGTYTALGQMAASALGILPSQVTVELGDTLLPEGPFSGGSQVTASLAPATEMAMTRLRGDAGQFGRDRRAVAAVRPTDRGTGISGWNDPKPDRAMSASC